MEEIDLNKTISKNRLIYKTHFIEFYEIFAQIILLIIFTLVALLLFKLKDFKGITIISIVILIMMISSIYKYKRGNLLISIDTGFPKDKNKQLINRVIKRRNYIIKFQDNDYLRANSRLNYFFIRHELTVIFAENKVLINIVSSTGLIRFPSTLGLKKFTKEFNEIIKAGT